MKEQRFIFVTFQKEGIHSYPDAPEGVEFLRHPHRHIFHFRVDIEVWNDDREIEFILFKRELEAQYSRETVGLSKYLHLDHKSCEMLADDLADYIQDAYPGRDLKIEVSEDGENGAVSYYPADREQVPILYQQRDMF